MKFKKMTVSMMVILLMILTHAAAAAGDTKADGNEVFKKTTAALGGAEKINGIKNVAYKMDVLRYLEDGSGKEVMNCKSVIQYPDQYWYWTTVWGYTAISTVDGKQGWTRTTSEKEPDKPWEPMKETDVKSQLSGILRDPIYISRNLDKYNITSNGEKDFDGNKAIELHITGLYDFKLYIDPSTYLPAGCMFVDVSAIDTEPVKNVEVYSDYKTVEGISVPFKQNLKVKGKTWAEVTIKEVKVNIKVEKDFFRAK